MSLNPVVLKHLEIFENSRGEKNGSLFEAINRTKTSAGSRLLRSQLCFPMTESSIIEERLQKVSRWVNQSGSLKKLREVLGGMGDIERRLGKIAQPNCNGRDLLALANSVEYGLAALEQAQISFAARGVLLDLIAHVQATLLEEQPLLVRQGHVIKKGVHAQLDEYILLTTDSQALLQAMENREREATGISSLKIRYNNVFGYYIEITHTHKDRVPAHYMRKQTLTNAERYCTDELVELEKKVLSAQAKRFDLEYELFEKLRQQVLARSSELLRLAQISAELDVETAHAWLALERNYCRPSFSKGGLFLQSSRHPTVEQSLSSGFVSNDIRLDQGGCLLLTGPNMAGKSTLMRQVALTAIMAQIGMFVPARKAELPVFDQIFTRIGASDFLTEGLSTFMVEMTETAEMLKLATSRSLLVLDEVGRGTSTFDGMSLAQSILEYILKQLGAVTFFATHYHELTGLYAQHPQLLNAHMAVAESKGEIQFRHTLVAGPAQKSYGIHVAKLAGLPSQVTSRAAEILKSKENFGEQAPMAAAQLSFIDQVPSPVEFVPDPVLEEIKNFSLNAKSPLDALNQIAKWQDTLSSKTMN